MPRMHNEVKETIAKIVRDEEETISIDCYSIGPLIVRMSDYAYSQVLDVKLNYATIHIGSKYLDSIIGTVRD